MEFDDLSEGDELPRRTILELSGSDMKLLAAVLQDPYPPHYDERRAEEMGYPGLLNQGPANLSYMLQTVVRQLEAPSDLRSFNVRFDDMVFETETVTATATVADKRVEDGEALVEFEIELGKEDGTVAVVGTATAHVPRE